VKVPIAEASPLVHQRHPDAPPDSDFEPGELGHLVPGTDGRMLDNRRTPIRVLSLVPETGSWVCEVMAFEDQGARWTLPVESVSRFQFSRGAARASAEATRDLEEQVDRFATPLVIEPGRDRAGATFVELGQRYVEAGDWLRDRMTMLVGPAIEEQMRSGRSDLTVAAFEEFMKNRGLLEMDHALASTWVSNPSSGEMVKGHLVVMAEIGLAAFRGRIVRDPLTFAGPWSRERRTEHVLWRMAFLHELLRAVGRQDLELYRGISSDTDIASSVGRVLESWSFSREVAESVAGPLRPDGVRVVQTRRVSCRRAFMTCLETRAMNRQFLEAEAVLFAEDSVLGARTAV
jgi:hypothetical protein